MATVSLSSAGNLYTASEYPVGGSAPYATDASSADAAVISSSAAEVIALVTSTSTEQSSYNNGTDIVLSGLYTGISLPASAPVNAVVVVIAVAGGYGFLVWAPVGQSLNGNENGYTGSGASKTFLKVDSTNWYVVASN